MSKYYLVLVMILLVCCDKGNNKVDMLKNKAFNEEFLSCLKASHKEGEQISIGRALQIRKLCIRTSKIGYDVRNGIK